MDHTTLGNTGLIVSVAGLGCGGHSRIGQNTGLSEAESVALAQRALDLGINIIDTAEGYRTESIVGQAIADRRDEVVISTKKSMHKDDQIITPDDLVAGVEASLKRLGTDRIEILHLHAVMPDDYSYAREHLVPKLLDLRDAGKILHLGVTEMFHQDCGHEMLRKAVADDCWEVVMVGFNILNQCARDRLFTTTMAKGIGTLCMFAVRRAFSRPDDMRRLVGELLESGQVDADAIDADDPLAFIVRDGIAETLAEAAYRFCRDEPGMDVILTGTGSVEHLEANVASINMPPLPEETADALRAIFERVDSVSAQ
ncbi:MAG TPA: aldo/keto reductase [Armatimonadota bacterium]|nr:aldo/keto reductase [Armatimonadota bacterium]